MIYGYENTHDLYTDFRLIPSTFKKTKALVPCKHVNKLKKTNKPGVLRKPPPPKKKKIAEAAGAIYGLSFSYFALEYA